MPANFIGNLFQSGTSRGNQGFQFINEALARTLQNTQFLKQLQEQRKARREQEEQQKKQEKKAKQQQITTAAIAVPAAIAGGAVLGAALAPGAGAAAETTAATATAAAEGSSEAAIGLSAGVPATSAAEAATIPVSAGGGLAGGGGGAGGLGGVAGEAIAPSAGLPGSQAASSLSSFAQAPVEKASLSLSQATPAASTPTQGFNIVSGGAAPPTASSSAGKTIGGLATPGRSAAQAAAAPTPTAQGAAGQQTFSERVKQGFQSISDSIKGRLSKLSPAQKGGLVGGTLAATTTVPQALSAPTAVPAAPTQQAGNRPGRPTSRQPTTQPGRGTLGRNQSFAPRPADREQNPAFNPLEVPSSNLPELTLPFSTANLPPGLRDKQPIVRDSNFPQRDLTKLPQPRAQPQAQAVIPTPNAPQTPIAPDDLPKKQVVTGPSGAPAISETEPVGGVGGISNLTPGKAALFGGLLGGLSALSGQNFLAPFVSNLGAQPFRESQLELQRARLRETQKRTGLSAQNLDLARERNDLARQREGRFQRFAEKSFSQRQKEESNRQEDRRLGRILEFDRIITNKANKGKASNPLSDASLIKELDSIDTPRGARAALLVLRRWLQSGLITPEQFFSVQNGWQDKFGDEIFPGSGVNINLFGGEGLDNQAEIAAERLAQ